MIRPEELTLLAFFNQLQAVQKRRLAQGLQIVTSLPLEIIDKISAQALSETSEALDLNPDRFAADTNLDTKDAQGLVPALPALLALIAARQEDAESFVDGLVESKLLEPVGRVQALRLVRPLVSARPALITAMQETQLARETIPSFNGMSISVDLRLGFEGSEVATSIPISLVYLKTDVEEKDVYFQATIADIRYLISNLTDALHQLEAARRWAGVREGK